MIHLDTNIRVCTLVIGALRILIVSFLQSLWLVYGFRRLKFNPVGLGWYVHGHFFVTQSMLKLMKSRPLRKLRNDLKEFTSFS